MPLPVRLFVAGTLAAALASLLSPSLATRQEAGGAALRDAGLPGIRIERRRGEADRRLLENGELKHGSRSMKPKVGIQNVADEAISRQISAP